jgi:DNA repair protein REV1
MLCSNFFKASRLHYIGTWKARYQQIIDSLPPPPPLPQPLKPSGERVILHIDMDCFFCSVAVRGRPEFKGMPVAVCWSNAESDKATHGEISSANYEARKYGIRAGMFIGKAKELCENLITLPYEFEKYSSTAEAMYREVFHLTPHVRLFLRCLG